MTYGLDTISKRLPELSSEEKVKIYDSLMRAVEEGYEIEIYPGPEEEDCSIEFYIHVKYKSLDTVMAVSYVCYSGEDIDEFIYEAKKSVLKDLSEGEKDVQGS